MNSFEEMVELNSQIVYKKKIYCIDTIKRSSGNPFFKYDIVVYGFI